MKKLIFKTLSLTLILAHLFTITLRDLSFAEEAQTSPPSEANNTSPAQTPDSGSSAASSETSPEAASPITPLALGSPGFLPAQQIVSVAGFNLATLQSFQQDPFTGRATFSLPIEVAPGRKGIQPNVALSYASGIGNSILGIGWSLELGEISRSTKKGAPKYDSTDTFIFNGSTELVNIGGNEYRAKIEGGFIKFIFNGSSWLVTDKAGTKYYFGQASSSRQEDGSRIFRWCLDKVIDLNSNYMTITYTKDQNQTYPAIIEYPGHQDSSNLPSSKVEFLLENRPDTNFSYRSGFRITTAKRLSGIRALSGNRLMRRYSFSYSNQDSSSRSYLTSVTQFGSDDSTSLPAITFKYEPEVTGWTYTGTGFPYNELLHSFDLGTRVFDINNDGLLDIIRCVDSTQGIAKVTYLNQGELNWQQVTNWQAPVVMSGFSDITSNGVLYELAVQVVDVNGDSWQDFIYHYNSEKQVYLNNRQDGWVRSTSWENVLPNETRFIEGGIPYLSRTGWLAADINADGFVDLIKAKGTEKACYINTHSGFQVDSRFNMPEGDFTDGSTQVCDLNADGLLDYFIVDGSQSRAYINIGSSWQREPGFNIDLSAWPKENIQLLDINSDGLADIGIAGQTFKNTYINTHSGWLQRTEFNFPYNADLSTQATRLADAKGRFLPDLLTYYNVSTNRIYLNNNRTSPGLLTSISNGIGGFIDITYKSSMQYDNTAGDGIADLPFPVYVVDSVTSSDGRGSSYATTYEYKNGSFDFSEREFRGFGFVKAIDSLGSFTETFFYQDSIFKGRPYLTQTKDASGNLYTKTENSWQHKEPHTGVYFPYLTKTDNYIYDGAPGYKKKTSVEFEYDAYGNPTKVISLGDLDVPGDEKTQITEYNYNTQNWLLSLPAHAYLLDATQNKASEKWFYYDDKGLLTKEETLLSNPLTNTPGLLPITYTYDEYGNLASSTDALGRTTTTTYDSTLHMFPIQITNASGQSVKIVYYGINESDLDAITGSGLIGQVKYTQDLNNQKTYNIYDKLGRLIKVIGPNDTENFPGLSYEYHLPQQIPLDSFTKLVLPIHTFDGIDDYLTFPDSPDWDFGTGDFTIDFWVKFNTLQSTAFIAHYEKGTKMWVFKKLISNKLEFYSNINSAIQAYFTTATTPDFTIGRWHHIAVVRNGSNCYMFVDGKSLPVTADWGWGWGDLSGIDSVLYIGTFESTCDFLNGSLDDLRVSKGIARWTSDFEPANPLDRPVKITKRVKSDYLQTPNYLTGYSFYDGLGRVIETKLPAEPNPQTGQARQIISGLVKYNSRGQVEENYLPYFIDESGEFVAPTFDTPHTTNTYDPVGRLIQVTNPDLTYSSLSYDGWVKTVSDENSHYKTEYSDAYGRITKIEEHNSAQTYATTYEYDTLGNLIKVVDNQNNITQIWYDSLGRKIKMDDPDMGVWAYEYDLVGNLKKQTDAKGQTLEFTYDNLNRLTSKKGLSLTLASYAYDTIGKPNCTGRLSKITDSSGSTEFFYDSLGREIKSIKTVTGSGSYSVERTYDALDRLVTLKYPDGEIVTYEYNPQGIEQVKGLSLNYVSNIDYSPTGQLTKIQYGNGTETNYAYDPNTLRLANLLTESPTGRIQDLSYSFDNVGNIINLSDRINTSSQSFLYDDLDRLIQAQGSYGTYTYAYDSIGNMISKEGVNLTYGKAGRLPHAVTQYGSQQIDYDANGNMISKELSPEGGLSLSYDLENRLTKVEETASNEPITLNLTLQPGWNFFSLPVIPADTSIASVLSSITGEYDQVSRYNSTTKQFEHYVGNSRYDQFTTFEYGAGYQIYITSSTPVTLTIQGLIPNEGGLTLNLKSGYNLIFCPKTTETAVEEALSPLKLGVDYSLVYHYNKQSSLFEKFDSSIQEFSTLKPGESYFIYLLKDTTWTITNSKPQTTFVYDGDGGRVKKTVGSDSTTYIGSLYEVESDGTLRKHIFAGSNRIATQGLSLSYFHSDHLGSSNVITDESGSQVGLTEFTPYGSISKQTGSYDPKHKFTGKELDSTTGLYFYGARYYDPTIGRFITADTIVQAPYDPQSLNRYSYCRNNPINYIDPSGLSWKSFWKKVGDFFSGIGKSIAANPGAFVASLVAGFGVGLLAANFVAPAMAGWFSAGGKVALTAAQNAIITGTEFGLGGFAGGFTHTLASGGSLRDAFKAGGIGFGIGFGIGGLAGYTYATGFQDFLHGFDSRVFNQDIFVNQIGQGNYAGASRTLTTDRSLQIRLKGAKVHFTSEEGVGGISTSGTIKAGADSGKVFLADLLPGFDNPSFTANTLQIPNPASIDPSRTRFFVGLNAKNLPLMPNKIVDPISGWSRFEYMHLGDINLSNTQVYGYYANDPTGHTAYIRDALAN